MLDSKHFHHILKILKGEGPLLREIRPFWALKRGVANESTGTGAYAAQSGAEWLRHRIAGSDGLSRIILGVKWALGGGFRVSWESGEERGRTS